MSRGAYKVAQKVYAGQLSRQEGKIEINRSTGMNEGSASAFITIFLAMMEGEVYKRAFNNETTHFLLTSIKKDYGEEAFIRALSAAQKHVNYYASLKRGSLVGFQEIIDELQGTSATGLAGTYQAKNTRMRNEAPLKKFSLYKNGVHLYDFDTLAACAKWLENIIGGSLSQGLSRIRDGEWIPDEKSQLFGYEVKNNIQS